MDTNEHEFGRREKALLTPDEEILHKAEVFSIVGAAMAVLNELGHGLDEKPYENALVVEFGLRRIAFQQGRKSEIRISKLETNSNQQKTREIEKTKAGFLRLLLFVSDLFRVSDFGFRVSDFEFPHSSSSAWSLSMRR